LNRRNLPEDDQRDWLADRAAQELTNLAIVRAGKLPEVRLGEVHDGLVYGSGQNYIASGEGDTPTTVAAFGLPTEDVLKISDTTTPYVAVGTNTLKKYGAATYKSERDLSGNVLSAYALRGDWGATPWPQFQPDGEKGVSITVSESPFWQIASERIVPERNGSLLQIPLERTWFLDGAEQPTGILLRWEKASEDFVWSLSLEAQPSEKEVVQASSAEGSIVSPDYRIRWILTAHLNDLDLVRAGKPLTDIEDGRFHYDAEVGKALVSEPLAE
jgi:hypothetical protein